MNLETRTFEVQESGNKVAGYAVVWDQPSRPITERGRTFVEKIQRGAFKDLSDVRLLAHHDKTQILARTSSGTLTVTDDDHGLYFEAELPDTTLGRDIRELLRRGDLSQMSFGFTITRDQWNRNERTVTAGSISEVSIVTDPAYPQTSAQLREHTEMENIEMENTNKDSIDTTANDILALRSEIAELKASTRKYDTAPAVIVREEGKELRSWLQGLQTRDIGSGSSNAPIPNELEQAIFQKLAQENTVRQLVPVVNWATDKKVSVEAALPTTSLVAEAGAITPSDPTFAAQVQFNAYKYLCATKVSYEFLKDAVGTSGVGSALDYLSTRIAQSISNTLEDVYLNGDGTNKPNGIANAANVTLAAAAGNTVDLGAGVALTTMDGDDLIDLYFALAPQYRKNGVFLMSDAALAHIRKLKADGATGDYLFKMDRTGDLTNGVPGTLMGRPVYTSPAFNSTTGNAAPYVLFADFSKYALIADRQGMDSLIDPYSASANLQTIINMWMRTDINVMLPEAGAFIVG